MVRKGSIHWHTYWIRMWTVPLPAARCYLRLWVDHIIQYRVTGLHWTLFNNEERMASYCQVVVGSQPLTLAGFNYCRKKYAPLGWSTWLRAFDAWRNLHLRNRIRGRLTPNRNQLSDLVKLLITLCKLNKCTGGLKRPVTPKPSYTFVLIMNRISRVELKNWDRRDWVNKHHIILFSEEI